MMVTEVTVVEAVRSDLYTNKQQCMLAVYGRVASGEWLLRNNNTDATFVVAAFIRHRKVELNLSLRTP